MTWPRRYLTPAQIAELNGAHDELDQGKVSRRSEQGQKPFAASAVHSPSRNVGPTLRPVSKPNNAHARKHKDEKYVGGADVSGGRELADVLHAFDELLYLPDHGAVLVALAGIVANYASGDAVWPLLVGPPGCGKSEVISSLTSAPGVWPLSSLTPQTLLSGFERKGMPASMLLQIGEFGILAFKDLTTV